MEEIKHISGKSEVESVLYIVMMASDGLQYQIEYKLIDKAIMQIIMNQMIYFIRHRHQ